MNILFEEYIRACYPVMLARTSEPKRFTKKVLELCKNGTQDSKLNRSPMFWDMHKGLCLLNGESIEGRNVPEDERVTTNPLEALKKAEQYVRSLLVFEKGSPKIKPGEKGIIFLMYNLHFVLSEPTIIQQIQNMMGVLKTSQSHIIIVGPGSAQFPIELDRDLVIYDFELPNRDELTTVLERVQKWTSTVVEGNKKDELLNNLQGLTEEEAESALSVAFIRQKANKGNGGFDPKVVGELKAQLVKKSSTISIGNYIETFDKLIGFDNLKKWTLNRFTSYRKGLPRKGVLVLGGPGNGKSMYAKALGNEVGLPVLSLNLDEIFGSLVGQSEAQLREALKIVVAMAPCIVIVDEIEKALSGVGGSSTDGGTTQRVGGIFLRWLQDNEAPVFVVATCNDYSKLPPEYTRMGRWDLITFVDNPDEFECNAILDLYLKEFTGKGVDQYPTINLSGYSGAEIRQVAIEAAYNGGDLELAAKFVIPLSRSNAEQMEKLRKWASDRTVPASIRKTNNKVFEEVRQLQ